MKVLCSQGEEEEEMKEVPKVGRLQNPFNETLGEETPLLLSGARRLNKGARISCLIENLATDRQPDGGDEDMAAEDR